MENIVSFQIKEPVIDEMGAEVTANWNKFQTSNSHIFLEMQCGTVRLFDNFKLFTAELS